VEDRGRYILGDQPDDFEFRRLSQQADLYAPPTKSRLLDLGLAEGMRCLEVGPGTGPIVRWMVERGAFVSVVDISDRYFKSFEHERVDARVGDVRSTPLGSDFDFVIVQWVLHHLPERAQVVHRLATCLRPGGWLVASEPDTTGAWTQSGPLEVAEFFVQLLGRVAELGVDYRWGAEIPATMKAAGLDSVEAGMWTPLVGPGLGGLKHVQNGWATIEDLARSRGWASDEALGTFGADLLSSDLLAGLVPTVLGWGRRPFDAS
jgi:SAM-dependent methyltransferase